VNKPGWPRGNGTYDTGCPSGAHRQAVSHLCDGITKHLTPLQQTATTSSLTASETPDYTVSFLMQIWPPKCQA